MIGIFLLVSVSMAPLQGPDEKINRQKWDVAIAAMKPRQEKFTSAKFLRKEEKQESPGLSPDWRIPPPPIWTQRMSVFPNPIVDPPGRKPESMEVFRGCFTPIFQLPIRRPTPIALS